MDVTCFRLEENRCLCSRVRSDNDRNAAAKSQPVLDPELIDKDDRHTHYADTHGDYLLRCYPFIWQEYPRQHESKDRDHRLQHCCETGRDVLLRPEHSRVVDRELKHASQCDQTPLTTSLWQRDALDHDD